MTTRIHSALKNVVRDHRMIVMLLMMMMVCCHVVSTQEERPPDASTVSINPAVDGRRICVASRTRTSSRRSGSRSGVYDEEKGQERRERPRVDDVIILAILVVVVHNISRVKDVRKLIGRHKKWRESSHMSSRHQRVVLLGRLTEAFSSSSFTSSSSKTNFASSSGGVFSKSSLLYQRRLRMMDSFPNEELCFIQTIVRKRSFA